MCARLPTHATPPPSIGGRGAGGLGGIKGSDVRGLACAHRVYTRDSVASRGSVMRGGAQRAQTAGRRVAERAAAAAAEETARSMLAATGGEARRREAEAAVPVGALQPSEPAPVAHAVV